MKVKSLVIKVVEYEQNNVDCKITYYTIKEIVLMHKSMFKKWTKRILFIR